MASIVGVAFVGLLLSGATVSAALVARSRASTPAVPSASVSAISDPLRGATATVEIEVFPPEARIYWDDRPVEGNPAVVSVPSDDKRHLVRAEAPGYVSESESIGIGGGVSSFSFSLEPITLELGFVSASGPVPDADDVVARLREPLRSCLDVEIAGDASIAGSASLLLDLSPKGVVRSVSLKDVQGFSTRGLACLEAVPKEATFSTGGKPQTVRVSVAFHGHRKNAAK